jgi:hypothetical protein
MELLALDVVLSTATGNISVEGVVGFVRGGVGGGAHKKKS